MFVGRDEHDLRPRLDLDIGRGPQAVAPGHLYVEDNEIGRQSSICSSASSPSRA
jgi:hypothetical protein